MNWHVELHTDPGCLPGVSPRLTSNLPVVMDHMGKPLEVRAGDATISNLRSQRRGRVSVNLSGAYPLGGLDPRGLAQLLLGELGLSALLWGSDWPCTNHEDHANYSLLVDSLSRWMGADFLNAVLCVNPLRLFWEIEDVFESPTPPKNNAS
jgi:predicted TIM-barrel fold metal-dependent hydrolase